MSKAKNLIVNFISGKYLELTPAVCHEDVDPLHHLAVLIKEGETFLVTTVAGNRALIVGSHITSVIEVSNE